MSKFKVGDRVRVIANKYGHKFDIGEVVRIVDVTDDDYYAEGGSGRFWWVIESELLPVPQAHTLTTGQTYTSVNGNKWECIFARDGKAWLVGIFDGKAECSAYAFDIDGTASWAGGADEYRIVFGPVRETVTDTFDTEHGAFTLSLDLIYGDPDWTTAKVSPV